MLIIGREYIEQSGGDPTDFRLCGQVNDPSAWSICRINMLLHGLRGADIQRHDTLLHPMHREAGELERFDRVIANPPFNQNDSKNSMKFPERFRWGWCPTTGNKATDEDNQAAQDARDALQSYFDDTGQLDEELQPYKQIKAHLSAARAKYRELVKNFVMVLKQRCAGMSAEEKQALVLELLLADLQSGLRTAFSAFRQSLVARFENLWNTYPVPEAIAANEEALND